MKMPIVLSENGDISIYDSLNKLESHIEPVDVLNSEFEIYDSAGKRLSAEVGSRRGSGLFGLLGGTVRFVKVFEPDNAEVQNDRLQKLLKSHLQNLNELSDSYDDLSISDLIERIR